ncbi:hypothetical protein D3C76_1397790 [compost metagenome]
MPRFDLTLADQRNLTAYLKRLGEERDPGVEEGELRLGLDPRQASLQVNTLCALRLLTEGLKQIGRDASRERLVAALEGLHDIDTGLTPALGFGPGRRQGMAGAHVIAVGLPGPRFTSVAPYRPVPDSL